MSTTDTGIKLVEYLLDRVKTLEKQIEYKVHDEHIFTVLYRHRGRALTTIPNIKSDLRIYDEFEVHYQSHKLENAQAKFEAIKKNPTLGWDDTETWIPIAIYLVKCRLDEIIEEGICNEHMIKVHHF